MDVGVYFPQAVEMLWGISPNLPCYSPAIVTMRVMFDALI